MNTLPASVDRIGYPLSETEGHPPSADHLVSDVRSTGGCSTCSAVYTPATRELELELSDGESPLEELEVEVAVTAGGAIRYFQPSADAVLTLLRRGVVSLYLPPDVVAPSQISLTLTYKERGSTGQWTLDATILSPA